MKGAVFMSTRVSTKIESKTILVVEDDPDVRLSVAFMVRKLGYRVLEAEDGQQALPLLQSGEAIDLLLTDVVMPGKINGTVLARKARQIRPGLKVLLMTGNPDNAIKKPDVADTSLAMLMKPFTRKKLAVELQAVLAGREG